MRTMLQQTYRKLVRSVIASGQDAEPKAFLLGIFCVVGFPLYYAIWSLLWPQPFESLGLRAAAMLYAALGLVVKHWPPTVRRYFPLYWYTAWIFCGSFFFTFMLLKNDANAVWSGSFAIIVSLIAMNFDVLSALLLLLIGVAAAFAAFIAGSPEPIPWRPLLEQAPVYLFAISVVAVFNLELARQRRARIEAAVAFGGHIAHELRTPLATIQAAADVIASRLPEVLPTTQADPPSPGRPPLTQSEVRLVLDAPAAITREVEYAFLVIDLALANSGNPSVWDGRNQPLGYPPGRCRRDHQISLQTTRTTRLDTS